MSVDGFGSSIFGEAEFRGKDVGCEAFGDTL